jgi:lysozyme
MYVMSDAGRQALTESFEGDILTAYPDPGSGGAPYTIGYGHTGPDVTQGMTCTQEQADAWLASDLMAAEAHVSSDVKVPLTQHEADACIDFVYNLGDRLEGSTLLADINDGNLADCAAQFERWDIASGHVMAGLLRRRIAESNWFNTPDT